jgi:IstB-like ATP binding protein
MLQSLAITPGTGKSHLLLALGSAAVNAGHRVRYYSAADLVDTLYRGLADNSVGRVIDGLLRHDLIIVDLCGHGDYAEAAGPLGWELRLVAGHLAPGGVGIAAAR